MKLGLMNESLGGIEGAIAAARAGRIASAVIIHLKPLIQRPEDDENEARLAQLVKTLRYSVVLAAHRTGWHADADVVLPVAAWSEEEGTYTNYQGRIQLAGKPLEPLGAALPVWEAISMLSSAGGDNVLWLSPQDIFSSMSEREPAFRGLALSQTRLPGVIAGT
jgi:predicted molibdopterin-dependent oxidoreductase YjgC